jgi:hypothetical protein
MFIFDSILIISMGLLNLKAYFFMQLINELNNKTYLQIGKIRYQTSIKLKDEELS